MERFKGISPHRPLGDSPTEIRIVNLLPGECGDPIECVLEHIDMETTKDYEALSYCWGEPSITKPILLESKPYPVTTNLFDGLQRLRKSDGPRRLWIDSLCINQSDVAERSREVQKMGPIYTSASNVVIWLGECLPWSEARVQAVFDYVTELAVAFADKTREEVITRHGYTEIWRKQQNLMEFLSQHQWFERIWVVQEVVLRPYPSKGKPEATPIFMCGRLKLQSYYIVLATCFWLDLPPHHTSLALLGQYKPLDKIVDTWSARNANLRQGDLSPGMQLLDRLMETATSFRATDSRDLIYALLGLVVGDPLPSDILPDYNKPVQQVLCEFGRFFLERCRCLDIIQFTSCRTLGLPSWVPDWKHSPARGAGLPDDREDGVFKVTDQYTLEVDWLQFDTIDSIGPNGAYTAKQDDAVEFLHEYLDSAFAWARELIGEDKSPPEQEVKAFIKELLVRFNYAVRRIDEDFWHRLVLDEGIALPVGQEHLCFTAESPAASGALDSTATKSGIAELWHSVAESTRDRSMFMCPSGSLGMMEQKDVQPLPGDLVGSLPGASCEFVLRPCSEKATYKIIGQCHRTVQVFDHFMEDLSVWEWARGRQLQACVRAAYEKYPSQRITIC